MKKILGLAVLVVSLAGCQQEYVITKYSCSENYDVRSPSFVFDDVSDIGAYTANCFVYKTDQDNFGQADFWQSPQATIDRGSGDCEDFAILSCYFLEALDIETKIVFIKINDNKFHALVFFDGFYREGKGLALYQDQSPHVEYEYSIEQALSVCYNQFGSRDVDSSFYSE